MIPFSIVIGLFVPLPFYIAHRIWPRFGADRIVTPVVRRPSLKLRALRADSM